MTFRAGEYRSVPETEKVKHRQVMRRYVARKAAAEGRPAPVEVVPWSDAERGEVESAWLVAYRRAFAGWLLGQRSEHTRRAYAQAWRTWEGWCREAGLDPLQPGPGAGGAYMASMQAAGLAPATRKLRMSVVRQALTMLTVEGLRAGGDPFAGIHAPVVADVSASVPLSDEQVRRVLQQAAMMPARYEVAVLLGAVVGMRSVESGQVCAEVVQHSPWGEVAQVVRKGGKTALMPIPPVVLAAAARGGWAHSPELDRSGNARRVRYFVEQVGAAAGVQVQSHDLRRWHATTALDLGVPLQQVQDALGHADPRTTQQYNLGRRRVEEHTAWKIAEHVAERFGGPVPGPMSGTASDPHDGEQGTADN